MDNFNNQQQGYQQPMGQPMQQQMYQQPQMQQQMYQQPQMQQPMYQQPMNMGYQQPGMQAQGGGIGAYFASLSSDVMNIVKLVGAIMLFLAPLLSWISVKITLYGVTEKDSKNLFGCDGVAKLFAILLMLLAVVIVLYEIADYIPALASVKASLASIPYVDLIICAVALLVAILAMVTLKIEDASFSDMKTATKLFGGKCTRGIGTWMAILGAVVAAVPSAMKIAKK